MMRFVCGSGDDVYISCVEFIAGADRRARSVGIVRGVRRDREAVHRAHVDARVALDAQARREVRLDVAIEAPLHFARGLLPA